ncbi:MAG: hypothetical protein AAFQ82_02460, partial [Myxococcota bacterium]
HTIAKDTAFKAMFGEALSIADLIVSATFVAFYVLALRHRHTPALHARYMLATVILLAGPSISRLLVNFVPGFLVRSLETLPRFGAALDASLALTIAFCLVLMVRDFRKGESLAPFSATLVATVAMWIGFYAIGYTEAYGEFARWFAAVPAWQITAFACITTVSGIAWGWRAPLKRSPAIAHVPSTAVH